MANNGKVINLKAKNGVEIELHLLAERDENFYFRGNDGTYKDKETPEQYFSLSMKTPDGKTISGNIIGNIDLEQIEKGDAGYIDFLTNQYFEPNLVEKSMEHHGGYLGETVRNGKDLDKHERHLYDGMLKKYEGINSAEKEPQNPKVYTFTKEDGTVIKIQMDDDKENDVWDKPNNQKYKIQIEKDGKTVEGTIIGGIELDRADIDKEYSRFLTDEFLRTERVEKCMAESGGYVAYIEDYGTNYISVQSGRNLKDYKGKDSRGEVKFDEEIDVLEEYKKNYMALEELKKKMQEMAAEIEALEAKNKELLSRVNRNEPTKEAEEKKEPQQEKEYKVEKHGTTIPDHMNPNVEWRMRSVEDMETRALNDNSRRNTYDVIRLKNKDYSKRNDEMDRQVKV